MYIENDFLSLNLNFQHDFHYKRTGVRVCGLCPGVTETGKSRQSHNPTWSEELKREASKLPKQSYVSSTDFKLRLF
jgi:hypothetical protein